MSSTFLKSLRDHAKERLKPAVQGHLSPQERIALYKRFLKLEEHRILLRHRSGGGGLEIANARAELLDVVLESVFRAALSKRQQNTSPLAIVAVGGYGRGILNPRSDVDLLFLLPRASNQLPEPLTELIQEILYLLWDVGFKVGHSSRSIAECIAQAKADQENKTALMDARLLVGDKKLFTEFGKRFEKECVQKGQQAFFDLRRKDLRSRHVKYSRTVFLQEPNVKESCGSLRDYQNIQWVARVKRGNASLQKLVDDRILTQNAWRELEEAHDFLHRVRNDLHYHTGTATDILTLQLQGVVATNFGYPQRSILRRTEAFMRDYYRHTRNLYQHTTSLMEIFQIEQQEAHETGLRSFLTFRKKKREEFDGFIARDGRIYAANPGIFRENSHRIMRLFLHMQARGLKFSPQIRKMVKENWDLIDRQFRYSKTNRGTFQAILERKGDVAHVLRNMHRVGVLGRYLPEFGALDCLVQHEFFHRYTADEHTLRCIDQLDALSGNEEFSKALFVRLFQAIEDPYALYLALILHDTGRAENVREHIDGSAMLAARLCKRLQITGNRRALIMFLVDNHLTFWRTATTRNIEDPEVIAEFAAIMKTPERLDALLLFTYADTNGTSPDAWNGWKQNLLVQLHAATHQFLAEGREKYTANLQADVESLRSEVTKLLEANFAPEIETHFAGMPMAYFRFRNPQHTADQIRTVHQFLDREAQSEEDFECAVQWIDQPERGYTELIVVSRDRPLLLEKICCALASEELNILSADFFTRNDGVVVDIFRVCTTNLESVSDKAMQTRIVDTLYAINQEEVHDPSRYLRRKPNFLRSRNDVGIAFPVRALVSNSMHPAFTTVEIQAIDRIGLLHDLFHAINGAGLNTANARICTEKGAAVDTLYITTADGQKVTDAEVLRDLRSNLEQLVGLAS